MAQDKTNSPEHAGDDNIHPLSRKFLWLGDEKVVSGFIWIPLIGLIITIMGGLLYPFEEGHKAPWDFFASWALIGFLSYSFVVLSAEPLFKLLARDEDYYGEGSIDD